MAGDNGIIDIPKRIQYAIEMIKKEMIRCNLVAEQGSETSVSKDHIYMFLSQQDLSDCYEDLNLIFHVITGVEGPDVFELTDEIKEDFSKINTTSSLSLDYRRYKLLQCAGYPIKKEDFCILANMKNVHDEKTREAWDNLGWKWIPTF